MSEYVVRENLPTPVAAVAARRGSRIAVIVDKALPESTADWAGELAFTRMNKSHGRVFGMVMRDEIESVIT